MERATAKIEVNPESIEQMLIAIHDTAETLWYMAYGSTFKGVVEEIGGDNSSRKQAERAYNHMNEYHDHTSAALRLISYSTAIIADAIINDEIQITAKQA